MSESRAKKLLRKKSYREEWYYGIPTKTIIGMERHPPLADIAARRAEIPLDTRDLTARVCGDPLPGRRAIDRRPSA